MLADRSRSLTSGPEARQKLLVLALLAGDRSAADQLLRDAPGLFATIEDFMWFRIAIIRPEADKSLAASTVGRAVYTLSGELPPCLPLVCPRHLGPPRQCVRSRTTLSCRIPMSHLLQLSSMLRTPARRCALTAFVYGVHCAVP